MGKFDPDALHYHDATYNTEPKLKNWASGSGKQLCLAYIEGSPTAPFAQTVEGWKLPKFRSAHAVGGCKHEEVPFYAFPYFVTGKTSNPKRLDPPTCTPL
jgi:hypothetical protein